MNSTAFEILAQQYREWHVETLGEGPGLSVAEDALATAMVARFDVGADYCGGWLVFRRAKP